MVHNLERLHFVTHKHPLNVGLQRFRIDDLDGNGLVGEDVLAEIDHAGRALAQSMFQEVHAVIDLFGSWLLLHSNMIIEID